MSANGSPNSQNAMQTLGSAPLNKALSRSRNLAQEEAGAPGRGNIGVSSDAGILGITEKGVRGFGLKIGQYSTKRSRRGYRPSTLT